MGAFGEKLRKQREQRGLALDAISNTTKISTRMLRALEDEHFDQLPGGVFNKGFVRAYARQVGLDEEETLTDYLAALRESQIQSQQILPDFRAPGGKPRPVTPHDDRHHILPASEHPGGDARNKVNPDLPVAERRKQDRRSQDRQGNKNGGEAVRDDARLTEAARIHAGKEHDRPENASPLLEGQVEQRRSQDRSNADRQQDAASVSGFITFGSEAESSSEPVRAHVPRVSRITLAAAILIVTVGVAVWTSHRRRESASNSSPASTSPASPISAQTPAPTTTLASSTPSASKPAVAKSPAATLPPSTKASVTPSVPKPSANPAPATAPVPKIAAPAPAPVFTLLIRAEQTTWVSIIADGKPVSHETLIAPAHTSVRATHDLTVRVGNAAGVSFLLNGKEFPAEGNVGEAKTYTFDASGLRAVAQTPTQTPVR